MTAMDFLPVFFIACGAVGAAIWLGVMLTSPRG